MATIMVDVSKDSEVENIMSAISLFNGVNKVLLRPKTQTDILIEKMLAGEDVDDNEYFDSIPGMWESIEAASKEPIENCTDYLEWE